MKSKGLYGKKYLDIEQREFDAELTDDNHVIVKVHACGICGTDINFVRDWDDEPEALGHEIAAEVVEVGKGVTSVKPGDKATVEDCTMCGICENCKCGNPQFCRNMYDMEGQPGMAEYISVRFNCLNRFDGIDYKSACLTEPLAVSVTSVLNAQIPLGGSVVVLGPGPLGLMAARLAKLQGADFVAITGLPADNECEKARLTLARKLGCDMTIEVGKQSVEDEIKKKFPDGVDRVIVSSPPQSVCDALKVIKFGGIITYFGLHFGGKNVIDLDVNDMIFRKISLIPTFAEPAINFPLSNRLIKDGLIDADMIITHTCTFDNVKETLQAVVEGTKPIIKPVFLPHG